MQTSASVACRKFSKPFILLMHIVWLVKTLTIEYLTALTVKYISWLLIWLLAKFFHVCVFALKSAGGRNCDGLVEWSS